MRSKDSGELGGDAHPGVPSKRAPLDLERALGGLDATMIVVGILIGSGIFIVSAESARLVGATGWLLVVWALAGLMTITGCQCGAELAAMLPRAGGQYVFLREAYGPFLAFLFGWALFLIIQTGKIAAVGVAFASFSGVLIPWISADRHVVDPIALGRYAVSVSTQQLIAIAVILLLTAVNTGGLNVGKRIQNTLTFVKVAALITLIVVGLTAGLNRNGALLSSSWWSPTANGWSPQQARPDLDVVGGSALVLLLGLAMVGPLFAQTGWANVTFTGGEVRNPGRNLPRALTVGTAIVVTLYLLANLAYAATLPLASIQQAAQNRVGTAMMQAIFGTGGAVAMAAVIMISTFSANNGLILAGARVYYAMARDGLFFGRVGTVNARHVPAVALVSQGFWASLLTLPRTVTTGSAGATVYGNVYTQLLEYIISAELVFYALMVGAVIVLRRTRPAAERPYRTFGYPVTPLIYISMATLLILDLAYLAPTTAGIGFMLVLSGIPIYFFAAESWITASDGNRALEPRHLARLRQISRVKTGTLSPLVARVRPPNTDASEDRAFCRRSTTSPSVVTETADAARGAATKSGGWRSSVTLSCQSRPMADEPGSAKAAFASLTTRGLAS